MECALKMEPSSICSLPKISPLHYQSRRNPTFLPYTGYKNRKNEMASGSSTSSCSPRAVKCAVGNVDRRRSSLESLFCYDKPIPEEIIEEPIGISLAAKDIGDNPHCPNCEAKGAILCTTCSGSGLYVESILESQGIIVKVVVELGILCVPSVVAGDTFDAPDVRGSVIVTLVANWDVKNLVQRCFTVRHNSAWC
ncbi:hypothetical protein PHJA_002766600 [Phtheirospermum japonicum]|uniref:Uncharacterized protein n=1 Tax=Phtheirospermum japonicum TaxID=374723 RepID=A0A830DHH6_9LAMI|nr:hypothetical protein PHJA_002766600 [Phtheirospermum japonicum]